MISRAPMQQTLRLGRAWISTSHNIDPSAVLWHNPSCSKSVAALALLEASNQPFEIREYLKNPPSFSELTTLRKQLGVPAIEWSRTSDDSWLEHFDNATIYDDFLPDDDDILRAIEKFPIMMERPIFVLGDKAVVGRPIEGISLLLERNGSDATAAPMGSTATSRTALLEAVGIAAESAVSRGIDEGTVERHLMRMAAELHMLQR